MNGHTERSMKEVWWHCNDVHRRISLSVLLPALAGGFVLQQWNTTIYAQILEDDETPN